MAVGTAVGGGCNATLSPLGRHFLCLLVWWEPQKMMRPPTRDFKTLFKKHSQAVSEDNLRAVSVSSYGWLLRVVWVSHWVCAYLPSCAVMITLQRSFVLAAARFWDIWDFTVKFALGSQHSPFLFSFHRPLHASVTFLCNQLQGNHPPGNLVTMVRS